jgi:hypothetical protein
MKHLSARLLTALTALLAATAGLARADYMNWSYSSDSSVPGITVDAKAPSGGAAVQLTDYTKQAGASSIPVLAYVTSTSLTTPINFPQGSTYGLTLTITDNATHDSGTLTFTGTIAGALSATSSSLTNSFTSSTPPSLKLDGHIYTVSIPTTALADPTKPQQNILASVQVSDVTGGGTKVPTGGGPEGPSGGGPQGTPEPASLVLAGLGFSLFGAGRWLKGQRGRGLRSA